MNEFDPLLKFTMEHIDQMALCCGSHNENSCIYLSQLLAKHKISPNDPRVFFSQLLGMSDHISFNLSKAGYNVVKYNINL